MSSTIAGLGANSASLQRALMEAAEKALAEGAEMLAGAGGRRDAAATRTPASSVRQPRPQADAMIVELSERAVAEADESLAATMARSAEAERPSAGRPAVVREREAQPQRPASASARVRELPLDQLVRVLKGSGIGFKEAVKILGALKLDQPLPGKAVLRTMWDDTEAAPAEDGADATATRARVAPDVVRAPLDQLVRDKSWHRANAAPGPGVPTLASVVVDRPVNQVYVAGLTTVEYQRLVVMLGNELPAWFGAVRGARGLRGLMESRGYARLNTSRFAGMRLGNWCLGVAGMGVAWYAGVHSGMWW